MTNYPLEMYKMGLLSIGIIYSEFKDARVSSELKYRNIFGAFYQAHGCTYSIETYHPNAKSVKVYIEDCAWMDFMTFIHIKDERSIAIEFLIGIVDYTMNVKFGVNIDYEALYHDIGKLFDEKGVYTYDRPIAPKTNKFEISYPMEDVDIMDYIEYVKLSSLRKRLKEQYS